jgi:hypothetical protein
MREKERERFGSFSKYIISDINNFGSVVRVLENISLIIGQGVFSIQSDPRVLTMELLVP